ncbi:MAG TPA: Crp/Fnr family transcriptional regulator [Microvirga sp.]|jgi:CRP-like cAMP-binding protein
MANALTMKLEQFTRFDQTERQRLDELLTYPTKTYARGEDIIAEGKKVQDIHLVLTGLAARTKVLADGERQIMAFLIPGDLCDVEVFVLEALDHNITAMTTTTCVLIPSKVIEDLLTESSKLTKALWWSTMTDSAVLRERIVDHGSRDARERLAHLFYEMLVRYRIVAETTDDSLPFLITQEDLADATGMTPMHVNRTLQQLRSEGLINLKNKVLTVLDPPRLKKVAKFNANYLHLIRTEGRDREVSHRASDLVSPSRHGLIHSTVEKVKSAFKKE